MALQQTPRITTTALQIFATAAAYYAAGEMGLQLAVVRDQVSPLWPATGVAVVLLLLWGLRIWPGIALGAASLNLWAGPSVPAVATIAAGTTLACVAVYLLLRWVDFRPTLIRLSDALALVFFGLAGMLLSATVGSLTLLVAGGIPGDDFWSTWSVWWAGDAMGLLVVTPLLLAVRAVRWPVFATPYRWIEAGALLAGTAAAALVATRVSQVLFLVFPFLIWAALRFYHLGAMSCALLVSMITTTAAASGIGPFRGLTEVAVMMHLQAFNGTVAMTCLLLAAVTAARDQAHQTIQRAVGQLSVALAEEQPDWTLLDAVRQAPVSRRFPPRE